MIMSLVAAMAFSATAIAYHLVSWGHRLISAFETGMPRHRVHRTVVSLILVWVLLPAAVVLGGQDDEERLPPDVVYEDQAAAFAHNATLMATQTDLPTDAVERALAFQDALTLYGMQELLPRYEHEISAIWVDPIPATRGYVQFVAAVPPEVETAAARHGLDITFTGGGEISMAEHTLRSELAADALIAAGYQNFIAYSDRKAKVITIELQLPAGAPEPDVDDLADLVRTRIASDQPNALHGRAAEILPTDLKLIVTHGSGPIVEFDHSRGGNRVRDSNDGSVCTSGWSVSGTNGDGIITAGHCDGLNTFVEASGSSYAMHMQVQALNSAGDVEYHTTPTHAVLAEFYADATTVRDVTLVRPTNMMVGQGICFYGRSSNVRTCDHTVEQLGMTVQTQSGTYGKQARATNNSSVGGDSGGSWSTNTWAWGVHSSHQGLGGNAFFTPAQEAQTALANRSVAIKLK